MASSVTLKAAGLNVSPNQLDLTPGSLTEAKNVIIRRDNVVESRRGFQLYGTSFGTSTDTAKQLMTYKQKLIRHYQDQLQFETTTKNNAGEIVFNTFNGSYLEPEAGRRMRSIEANGNFYFTTDHGIKKISSTNGLDFSTAPNYITQAGGIKALDLTGSLDFTHGPGFLPQDSAVAYRVVWGENDANNNLILGAPSSRLVIFNPLSGLILSDFSTTLQSLDSIAFGSLINNGNYVATLGLPPNASPAEVYNNLLALAAKLDQNILYADTVSAPLQIGGASINSNIVTVSFSSGNPASYLVPASHITLTGFSPATGTLNGPQTVTSIIPAFSTATGTLTAGMAEITTIQTSIAGVQTITTVADGGGNLVGRYFLLHDQQSNQYAVWFKVSGIGTAPTVPGYTDIEVDINAFDSAVAVGTALAAAINLINSGNSFTATGTSIVTVTNKVIGAFTPATDGGIPTGFTFALSTPPILAASLGGTYFNINSANDAKQYYVWYQVSGVGVNPTVPGRTAIQVNISNTDSDSTIATQTAAAINALGTDFTAVSSTNTVTVTNVLFGTTTAAFAGTSGFTIAITQAGVNGNVITAVTDTSGVNIGSIVTGTGIPINTYVTDVGIGTVNISNNITIAGTSISLNFEAGITFIPTVTTPPVTVTGPITLTSPTIYSGEYEFITQPSAPSNPATDAQLVALQSYLLAIMTRLQNEPVTVIPAYLSTSYIQTLNVTSSANVDLVITIPQEVDLSNTIFFQIYRSAIDQATGVNLVSDLSPSDELQLVYEAYPTPAEIAAGIVNVVDVTPDSFRGANLYTNETTGEGILQSNDDPPIAKDIALFKGTIFFANTSTKQRLTLNLLGVQKMINDYNNGHIPEISITNGIQTYDYKFTVGVQQSSQFTTLADVANSLNGKFFNFHSANNANAYYAFYNTGITNISVANPTVITSNGHGLSNGDSITITGSNSTPSIDGTFIVSGVTANTFTIPVAVTVLGTTGRWMKVIPNQIGVRIDINTGDSAALVAQKTAYAISAITGSFSSVSSTNNVIITNIAPGYTLSATAGTTGFTVSILTPGQGENVATGEVLLSNSPSPATAVDETARSLVHVINLTGGGFIYAFYLSGANQVPGQILLENRVLGTPKFYVLGNNSDTGSSFNPDISPTLTISSIATGNPTVITTTTPHFLINKDQVVITDSNSTPSIDGLYQITYISPTQFSIDVNVTVAGTTGELIKATDAVSSDNEVKPARVYYSKFQQPEAVPIVNYLDVGAQDKQILRIFALRDSLFVFKEDGLYRISGETEPFNVALFDSSCIVLAPDSVDVSNNLIYAWTTQGITSTSESGVSIISRAIDIDILKLATAQYANFKTATWGIGYESDNSYTAWTILQTTDTIAQIGYRFSTLTNSWTIFDKTNTCGVVNPKDDRLYLGAGDTDYIEQERKNFDRYDYADREFDITLALNNYRGQTIQLNSTDNLADGDVCVQTQYLTSYEFNQTLAKMDLDSNLSPHNYVATLQAQSGDNIRNDLDALIGKIAADPGRTSMPGATPGSTYLAFQSVGTQFTISSISDDNPAIITTTVPHDLQTGRIVIISGSNSNPSVDGIYPITVTGANTFTIPIVIVSPGTTGFVNVENDNFLDVQSSYNSLVYTMNNDLGMGFHNYVQVTDSTNQEAIITDVNTVNKIITLDIVLPYLVGPIRVYKAIDTKVTWAPNTMNDPIGLKHMREATLMFDNKAFTTAKMIFSTDLLPVLIEVPFHGDGNGIFGHIPHFGMNYFGGASHGAPFRTYIPRNSQRCRYIVCSFEHSIAREQYALYGLTLTGEVGQSSRAYR